MNTMPWDYYIDRHKNIPKEDTKKVYQALQRALTIDGNNLLALHLYIHIYEASDTECIAKHVEVVADRLYDLMPEAHGIGHLIHMPSHIYIRIGRFNDGIISNEKAIKVAEEYFDEYGITDDGWNYYYRNLYYCHRHHMIMYCGIMSGQYDKTVTIAKKTNDVCQYGAPKFPFFKEFNMLLDKALIRFGKYEELLNLDTETINIGLSTKYGETQWEFEKAFALASLKKCDQAWEQYNNKFLPLANDEELRDEDLFWQKVAGLFDTAKYSFLARYYEYCTNDIPKSIESWEKAVTLVDGLAYMEPPFWSINIRSCLGQVLLNNGQYSDAEIVFERDLEIYQGNGWSYKGLSIALNKQGKDSSKIDALFADAWKYADFSIDKACY